MPERIDWTKLSEYEQEDNTVAMQTMACSGDSCEIVDLTAQVKHRHPAYVYVALKTTSVWGATEQLTKYVIGC